MHISYKEKSRDTDFGQHAYKIYTAIREIDPVYAEKRAIWELFQNALDVIDEKGTVKISKTREGLKFEHNGRPFNVGNLTGLIKQSSSDKIFGSNKKATGQYGTGFLSTHVYGKKVLLNATLDIAGDKIKKLNNFLINRDSDSIENLKKLILEQDELAEKICDSEGNDSSHHSEYTSFEYIENAESKKHICNMFSYIPKILPYIFAFNSKLHCVEIYQDKKFTKYRRNKSNDSSLDLSINGSSYKMDFIFDAESDIKIILPQNDLSLEDIPKLFLFYPLMETVQLGVNFIIHAQEFKPNKERDYLFLNSSNIELKSDIEKNKELLDKAYELIIQKVIKDELQDFLAILNIQFDEKEDPYLKGKKAGFINRIKDLERIQIKDDIVSLASISFIHSDVLDIERHLLKDIYPLLAEFYSIPDFEEYIYLSERVNNWCDENFTIICYQEILEKITKETKGNYGNIINQNAYRTLIETVSTDIDLLNKTPSIPNIHGILLYAKDLKKWDTVEQSLIDVMDAINCNVSKFYLHSDFYFIKNISLYNREIFKDDLNKYNNTIIDQLETNDKDSLDINSAKFNSIINSLVAFISLNKVTDINAKLSKFCKNVFGLSDNSNTIKNPTVDLNYDSSFKLLARLYVKFIASKGNEYVEQKIDELKEFIKILNQSHELKKNLLDKLACYPNQKYDLRSQNSIKIDYVLDEVFKDKHQEITGEEKRFDLLLIGFEELISHSDSIEGMLLGSEIEKAISPSRIFLPINDNNKEKLPILIDLVQEMSEEGSKWANWLPNINSVKEEILMYRFQNATTRSSLYSILTKSEETINLLGKIAKVDDLKGFIKAAEEKQKEEARKNNHLNYIKEIGLQIQNLIQHQLDESLAEIIKIEDSKLDDKLKSVEEQNGQDFIIYKSSNPIYYIEVKSRWDSDGIVALSKRQIERCADNDAKYAVITVNVADYKSRNGNYVEKDITFEQLRQDVYVNTDLSDDFKQLIVENQQFEKLPMNTKLIEFRGHIPQDRIKTEGVNFEKFIEELKIILLS